MTRRSQVGIIGDDEGTGDDEIIGDGGHRRH